MEPAQANHDLIATAVEQLKGVDSVELKVTVQETDHRSAIMALDMDVLDAEFRQVVFFDTPDLRLNHVGLVVRARRARNGGDTVIKRRPVQPAEVPKELRQSSSFNIEMDAMPGAIVCSGSMKGKADNADVKSVLLAKHPIRKLFSREQRLLFEQYAPRGITLDSLTALGPINAAKLKFVPKSFGRSLAAEVWFYPDASRILELSTKCAPKEAFQVLAEMRVFLSKRGVSLTGKQATKTRKALEYFSNLAQEAERTNRKIA